MPSSRSSRAGLRSISLAVALAASACGGGGGGTTPQVETPTFSPAAGTYTSAQSVAISSATTGASIFYTSDGTTPTTSSTPYTGPVPVGTSMTIKAIATAAGHSPSAVGTADYVIQLPAATPTFSPAAGTYTSAQSVAISSATTGASIFYTSDGTTPTTSSTPYTGPVPVGTSMTIKAIATAAGHSPSAVGTADYVITLPAAAAPTFTPPPGDYRGVSVTLSSSSPGATIYYTTNGSTPTTGSTPYAGPITIHDGDPDLTIRAIAAGGGWSASPVASATYTSAILVSLPFPTVGCFPSGSGLGSRGESVWLTRASVAEYLDASGTPHTCPADALRVGCDPTSGACGLLVEPAATQLHPSPTSPAAGTVTFTTTGWHQFWVVGPGSQTIDLAAASTLVATRVGGLPAFPCTATATSPCEFQVTTLGATPTAALSAVTGTLARAQIEANQYQTSFVPSGTRAADVAWIDNPLAGTLNLALWSEDLVTPAHWFPNNVTVVGGQTDSLGGTAAVLATAVTSGHTYVQESISVAESTAYTWSFDAKNDGGTAASYSVYCKSSAADIVPSTSYIGQLSGTAWTRVVVPFVTPPGCTAVNVYMLRDSGAPVSLFLAHPQLEPGTAFTSYSRTLGFPIASDASGGSWCVQGTWTPENGAPWLSEVRTTHYRVISTLENDDRDSFFLSYAWSSALTWDVFGADQLSKRLVPPPNFTPGSTHTVAGAYDHGAITLYEDGASVGTPAGTGTGVMDAQKAKLGLTPLAGDSASQPFGGFASGVKVFRRAACQ